jgi:hypothetical protein
MRGPDNCMGARREIQEIPHYVCGPQSQNILGIVLSTCQNPDNRAAHTCDPIQPGQDEEGDGACQHHLNRVPQLLSCVLKQAAPIVLGDELYKTLNEQSDSRQPPAAAAVPFVAGPDPSSSAS